MVYDRGMAGRESMRHDGRTAVDAVVWWICLVAAPLVLVAIELYHPSGFTHDPGMWAYLSEAEPHTHDHHALAYAGPDWWFTLHMIQTPTVGLVMVGLWWSMRGISRLDGGTAAVSAWLGRIAVFVTFVYFTVLDAIGGIGLGRSILQAQAMAVDGRLTIEQMDGIKAFLDLMWIDPWVGGVGSVVSLTASWAIFFATLFVALALTLARRGPLVPLVILVVAGYVVQISHAAPYGPTGFGLLALAGIWLWFRGGRPAPILG